MVDRIVYMRTGGGVPPNFLRLVVDAGGTTVAEHHHQFPPPARVDTKRGTISAEAAEKLESALAALDVASLKGPLPDSPNEWFEITTGVATSTFSIISLQRTATPGADVITDPPELVRIRAALTAIFDQIGGEPSGSQT